MAGRFDFLSPGAAATDTLANLMAQRKAEARQNMLDQLGVNADQRASQAAQEDHDWRTFQETQMTAQNERKEADDIVSHWRRGADPEKMGLAPEKINLLNKYGYLEGYDDGPDPLVKPANVGPQTGTGTQDTTTNSMAAALPQQSATPIAPTRKFRYVGSADEQKEETRKNDVTKFLLGVMANGNKPMAPGDYLAMLNEAKGGQLTGADVNDAGLAPATPVSIFDQEDGTFTNGAPMPSNGKLVTRTRPPQTPRMTEWVPTGGTDETGNLGFYNRYGDHAPTGVKPKASGNAAADVLKIPSEVMNHLHDSRVMFMGDNTNPTALASVRADLHDAIAMSTGSRIAQHLAKLYIDNPAAYQASMTNTPLTQKDIDDLQRLKSLVPDEALSALQGKKGQ